MARGGSLAPGVPAMMITEIEDFYAKGCGRCDRFGTPDCSTRLWLAGLKDLRRICLDLGMSEHVKWGHPCFMHAGRNIAVMGAFREDFRLSLFNAALMKDPEGVLEKSGPNTRNADVIRFRDVSAPVEQEATLRAYLTEAMGYAEAGITAPRARAEVDMPDELIEAMESDPEMAEAFHALTPGRQRSYAINLNGAKQPETRRRRIVGFRDKIIAGKGALDR